MGGEAEMAGDTQTRAWANMGECVTLYWGSRRRKLVMLGGDSPDISELTSLYGT